MRTATLGELEVSVIGLGCNNLGRALDREQSVALVGAALDAGINVFDVSDNYGEGRAESYLGAALGRQRYQVIIATKFGLPVPGVPGSGGARPQYVRRAIERSLSQLGTEYIDLYQLHRPDPDVPVEDTLAELDALVNEGKVREVGCSNLDAGHLAAAAAVARAGKLRPFIANQVEYSLLHRTPETDGLIEVCATEGIALLPYYPLASGMLTGKARRGQPLQGRLQMERYRNYLTDVNFDKVEAIMAFAAERGVSTVQVALGWLLGRPAVPFVTAGATNPEQIKANVAAADWTPSPADMSELDRLTGPELP